MLKNQKIMIAVRNIVLSEREKDLCIFLGEIFSFLHQIRIMVVSLVRTVKKKGRKKLHTHTHTHIYIHISYHVIFVRASFVLALQA